jgi:hypothetical protein
MGTGHVSDGPRGMGSDCTVNGVWARIGPSTENGLGSYGP